MQSDDYWPGAANFIVTEPTLDSTFIPRHLAKPTWLPYRAEAMLFSSARALLLRRRRDLLSDLQTGSERGRAFTNSTISAQFRDQIDFPLQPQPRLQTTRRLGDIERGRGRRGQRAVPIGRTRRVPSTRACCGWNPPCAAC